MKSPVSEPRRPQLDALRTFAVFAVMLGHFAPTATESLPLGQLGVRLFFVLSGFLITGILLNGRRLILEGAPPGGVLRHFYARRFLRLVPPYYALLAAMWIAAIPTVRDSLPWHVTYASNMYFSRVGAWHGETSHFWSLAVEEQFYLLWPLVVLFQSPRRTAIALVLIALVAPVFRLLGLWHAWSSVSMTALPFGSADSLALGALLALLSTTNTAARAWLSVASGWLSIVALIWTGLMVAHVEIGRPVRDVCLATLWSFAFVWVVNRSAIGFRGVVGTMLEHRAVVYLGRISYGLYLFHGVTPRLIGWLWSIVGVHAAYPPNALVGVGAPMLATVTLAALSWHVYEGPINQLKRYLPYDPRTTPAIHADGTHPRVSAV